MLLGIPNLILGLKSITGVSNRIGFSFGYPTEFTSNTSTLYLQQNYHTSFALSQNSNPLIQY